MFLRVFPETPLIHGRPALNAVAPFPGFPAPPLIKKGRIYFSLVLTDPEINSHLMLLPSHPTKHRLYQTVSLFQLWDKINPFPLKLLFLRYLVTVLSKVTIFTVISGHTTMFPSSGVDYLSSSSILYHLDYEDIGAYGMRRSTMMLLLLQRG